MQKATQNDGELTVKIGRFNEPTQEVSISEDSTIQDVLDELGYTLNSNETLWVGGVKANSEDIIEDGDYIQVTGKKEGGSDETESTDEVEAVDDNVTNESNPSDNAEAGEEPTPSEPEEVEVAE